MPPAFHLGAPPQAPAPAQPPTPPAKPRKRRTGLLVAVAVLAFVTGGGAGALLTLVLTGQVTGGVPSVLPGASPAESILSAAQRKCTPREAGVRLGDHGKSLTIQTAGKKSDGISITDLACLLREMKTTDAIISEMDTTRALDGRQSAEWNDLRASWTYHPDDGLNIVVTVTS